MSIELVFNAEDLPNKQFIPVTLNADGDQDYALTKQRINNALKQAEISNASILDSQRGYEIRFKDKLSQMSFLCQYDGDKEEAHRFEIKFDTDEKIIYAMMVISTAFNELNIQHDASLTREEDILRLDFKTRHAYVCGMNALRQR